MGNRSDVGFCLKAEAYNAISQKNRNFLNEEADIVSERDGDMLFYITNIKWSETPLAYSFLEDLRSVASDEDFYIVDAFLVDSSCSETHGEWIDNPWNLSLQIKSEVVFDTTIRMSENDFNNLPPEKQEQLLEDSVCSGIVDGMWEIIPEDKNGRSI